MFSVEYQSPAAVSVKSFKHPATLYCVPSIHDENTAYEWVKLGSSQLYHDAPVIYVREEGIFKCQVTHDSDMTASEAIRVEMVPGIAGIDGYIMLHITCVSFML